MSTASTAGTGAGRQAPRLNWKTPRTWATEVGISKTTNSGIIIPGQEVTGVPCALKESTAPRDLHMTIADQRGIIIITTPQHPIISTTIANKNQSINSSVFFFMGSLQNFIQSLCGQNMSVSNKILKRFRISCLNDRQWVRAKHLQFRIAYKYLRCDLKTTQLFTTEWNSTRKIGSFEGREEGEVRLSAGC